MDQPVDYRKIHSYMLQKTREYYACPPEILVDAVMEARKKEGNPVSREEARRLVSPIEIQRLVKLEMAQKWPEMMASIPSNPLPADRNAE